MSVMLFSDFEYKKMFNSLKTVLYKGDPELWTDRELNKVINAIKRANINAYNKQYGKAVKFEFSDFTKEEMPYPEAYSLAQIWKTFTLMHYNTVTNYGFDYLRGIAKHKYNSILNYIGYKMANKLEGVKE